ncbi:hypothetical protein CHS0354_017171 [Potamilus streckersoni]|uniref:C-type lectin domain-containing protein n=1 Tax=Potamilus streckersoni TaxID=2493646 RepID=A0AAE0W6C2_9BIVA|nr:hypothetical protein CHS0354_017171 [Potamilus streckersoni]
MQKYGATDGWRVLICNRIREKKAFTTIQSNGAHQIHFETSVNPCCVKSQQNKNISCPDKHVFTSGPFYVNLTFRIVFDEPIYQATAKTRCKQHGASLVTIDTAEKQTYLRYILQKCPEYSVQDYWIDGYDEVGDNKSWKYSDGRNMTMNNIIFWASYAPTDESERCVRMRKLDDYFWNDQNCLFHFGYICEKVK